MAGKYCCVCSDGKESGDNQLFRCGGQGCGIIVHQACYGIVNAPSGVWFCRKCESQERAARVKCELCPKKDGALKRTDSGSWAHVVCALYIPEVTFGNLRTMEPIVTTKLPKERFTKACYICEELGHDTQASTGACMSCHKSNCRLTFHVTCAQKEQLLVEEEDPRDSRNIIYCGYCSTHYKRMIKQKLKQQQGHHRKTHGPVGSGGGGGGDMNILDNIPSSSLPPPVDHMSTLYPPMMAPPLDIKQQQHKTSSNEQRQFKRTSSDAGMSSSSKRKYRRRKLSSSNESSTSEALSSTNEGHTGTHIFPSSPSVNTVAMDSSAVVKNVDLVSSNDVMDCGNLDLLASVTAQNEVNRIMTSEEQDRGYPILDDTVIATTTCAEPHPPVPPPPEVITVKENTTKRKGGGTRKKKNTTISSSNQRPLANTTTTVATTNSEPQSGPPLSLQDLLERQWEQTAQFILDQAGRQNNAGIMLAHLHELQSENRAMQARIMELASQREFFIATNARLRQTLAEGGIHKVINGIQLLSADNQRVGGDTHRNHTHHNQAHHNSLVNSVSIATNSPSPTQEHRTLTVNHHHGNTTTPIIDNNYHYQTELRHEAVPPNSYSLYSLSDNNSVDGHHYHHHDVTHVTNTVQGPIAAYTGFSLTPTAPLRVVTTSPSSSSSSPYFHHRHST